MGLDLVEFVVAVEEAFEVDIPDEKAGQLRTPGQVKEFVLQTLGAAESSACLSQRAFYRLRRAIRDLPGLPPRRVVPATSWAELLPRLAGRRAAWRDIGSRVGFRLPRLVRDRWLVAVNGALVFVAAGAVLLSWSGRGNSALAAALGVAVAGAVVTERLTRPACVRFGAAYSTVGAVAEFAATMSAAQLKGPREGWTRTEVSRVVDALIVECFGARDFNDESDFARDLHVD